MVECTVQKTTKSPDMIDMNERPSLMQISQDDQNSLSSDINETSDNDSGINKNNQPPIDGSDEEINSPNFPFNHSWVLNTRGGGGSAY